MEDAMNIIKKYWNSVYLYILPLIPGICTMSGIFWTILKYLGYYPEISWIFIFLFDGSHILYMAIAFYIIHRNKQDPHFLPNHLFQTKCYILTILLIQYISILNLFPSPYLWECTVLFMLVSAFFFDTKFQIINSSLYTFLLVLFYVRNPAAFLSKTSPVPGEIFSYQIIIYLITTLLIILITHLVENFLIQEQEDIMENSRLLKKQLDYYTHVDLMDRELRKFRHDIKNHFFAMNELLRQEKIPDLIQYFNDLQESFTTQDRQLYLSGNPVTDAILNHELNHRCSDTVQISVSGRLADLDTLSSMDICTIFSNLLTNAINAVNQCRYTTTPRLEIQFSQGNEYFSITVRNDSDQPLPAGIQQKISTNRNHGYGIKKIQEITEKYHGFFEQKQEDHMVISTILLPI